MPNVIPNNDSSYIHVDGGHDEQTVYNDLVMSFNKLKLGGVLAVDDFKHPDWEGLTKVTEALLSNYGNTVRKLASFNRYGARGQKLYLTKV